MVEAEQKKCPCGMPLDDKTQCKCNSELCIHCCECPDDCECDCNEKAKQDISLTE